MILRNTLRKWTRTVGEGNTIDEIVLPVLVPQKLFGFQILDASWKWKTHGWYIVLCVSLSIYMIAGSVAVIADGNVDLDIKNESPYVIILALINPIKAIVFVGNRETFQVLYLTAKTTLYSFVETASKTKGEKLLKSIKTLVCCVIGVTLIPVLQYQVTFFWKYANGEKILLSRSTYLLIPMERPYYEIASLMQNLFLLEAACIVMLLDTWFAFYALILCYACDTLCELLAVRPPEDQENRSQYVHRLDVSLKSFYRNHVIINEYLENLCKIYKWLGLVPLINVAMCLCVVLLVLIQEFNWSFISHILPLLTQVLCYSWFGESIISKMEKVKTALLNFDWINLSIGGKKSYNIIFTYMNRDFGVKTVNGMVLSLLTIKTVLSVSYQAFTVLNKVNK